MASKLGRLRQWAGDVISSKEKPVVNEEFKELEKDIELRKDGIQRLIQASEKYHHALSKKKNTSTLDDAEKMLPIDILGMVMILHGEEFREDSPFGNALVKLGRAHCKTATLQEAFALTFKDTFLASMERFKEEIKEYELLKKKLETRRAHYDSATGKFEKLQDRKKEKDRREAEDEMERARQRYEETAEDLRAHMHAIQENEHHQLRELTAFLDLETNYVQSYLEVLKDVKSDWQDRSDVKRSPDRDVHVRSFRSPKPASRAATPKVRERVDSSTSHDSSDDARPSTPGPFTGGRHSRSGSTGSKTPSRPASRLSRMRATSSVGGDKQKEKENGNKDKDRDRDKDKDKDKEKEKPKDGERSRRMSVAGWASNAVESVTSVGKSKKSKDKESFATLDDSDDDKLADTRARASSISIDHSTEGGGSLRKSTSLRALARRKSKSSKENLSGNSSSSLPGLSSSFGGSSGDTDGTPTGSRILKPPSLQDKKLVRALYDFTGSSPDELSFRAGSDIVVVQEVLDEWWMGELVADGQKGLFPASYVEVVGVGSGSASGSGSVSGKSKPGVVQRLSNGVMSALFDKEKGGPAAGLNGRGGQVDSDDYLDPGHDHDHDHDHDHYGASDADDEQIIRAVPMAANKSPVFYGGFNDAASITSSMADTNSDEEFGRRVSHTQSFAMPPPSPLHQQFDGEGDGEKMWFPPQTQAQQFFNPTPAPAPPPSPPAPAPTSQSRRNILKSLDTAQQPLINRSLSDNPAASLAPPNNTSPGTGASTPTKRIPPPPPPRRTVSHNPSSSPPIPERKAPSFVSHSSSSLSGSISSISAVAGASVGGYSNVGTGAGLTPTASSIGYGYDRSPFESAVDLDDGGAGVAPQRCEQFRQNPFKPKGMCSNCLEFHD